MMTTKQTQSIRVPTMKTKLVTKIDLKQMSENDIISLKESDPFMYHSIPAVYKANLNLKETEDVISKVLPSRSSSQSSSIVYRRTRLSTESDILLDDELMEFSMMLGEGFEIPEDLVSFFGGDHGSGCD